MDISALTAVELAEKIHSKEISVKEALDAYFAVIEEKDKDINAYITLNKEDAYAQAVRQQKEIDNGNVASALAGVPIAVKDNICTKGIKTTCASKILDGFVPTYDATAV